MAVFWARFGAVVVSSVPLLGRFFADFDASLYPCVVRALYLTGPAEPASLRASGRTNHHQTTDSANQAPIGVEGSPRDSAAIQFYRYEV